MKFDFLRLLVEMLDSTLNEDSPEFKAYLLETGIEKEVVPIPFIHHRSVQFQHREEKNFDKYYSFIDKNIYEKVLKILIDFGNEDKIDRISLILKVAYYNVIKAELSEGIKSNSFDAEVELYAILKFINLEKVNNEIIKVKLETNQTKDNLVIKNTIIINYIKKVLKRLIEDYFDSIELDEEENKEDFDWHFQKPNYSKARGFFICLTTIDILEYLTFTGEEDQLSQFLNSDYSNKQLVVAFKLLEAANLVKKGVRTDEEIHKFLRTKIKRFKD